MSVSDSGFSCKGGAVPLVVLIVLFVFPGVVSVTSFGTRSVVLLTISGAVVVVVVALVVLVVIVETGRKCGSISTSLLLKLPKSSRSRSRSLLFIRYLALRRPPSLLYRSAVSSMSSASTSLFWISSRRMEMCLTSPYMRFIRPWFSCTNRRTACHG